jgi:hypothetical protein
MNINMKINPSSLINLDFDQINNGLGHLLHGVQLCGARGRPKMTCGPGVVCVPTRSVGVVYISGGGGGITLCIQTKRHSCPA